MDAARLRPLRVGEILDLGIKIYQRRFRSLVRAVAVVAVPVALLSAVVNVSAGAPQARNGQPVTGHDISTYLGATAVVSVLTLVATQLAAAASFEIVRGDYLDVAPTWQDSLRAARRRLRSLVWVAILGLVLAGLALLLCIAPGVYLWGCWSVAVPVLLVEDLRGRSALKRSRELVRGRWWPTVGVLLITTMLAGIVRAAASGVLLAASAASSGVVEILARALASSVSTVLTTPFSAAVVTVLYFDLRVRKEGFDLELLARQMGGELPDGTGWLFAPEEPEPTDQPPFWPPPPGWRPGGGAGA